MPATWWRRSRRKTRLSVKLDELHDLYDINRQVGTETGRGLNARKMLANDTYGLTNNDPTRMLNDKRAVNGGEALSPEVRKQVEDLHKKMFKTSRSACSMPRPVRPMRLAKLASLSR
jgi:hypothetical protein